MLRHLRAFTVPCFRVAVFALIYLGVPCATNAGGIFDDDYVPPERSGPPTEVQPPGKDQTTPAARPSSNPAAALEVAPPVLADSNTRLARQMIPSKEQQTKSRKLFKEAFADQLKNQSVAGRIKLAHTLLDQAAMNRATPVDCFVLLGGALESAEEGADLNLSFSAADELGNAYQLDPLAAKADAATKVWSRPVAATMTRDNVSAALGLVDRLVQDDDFTTASRIESLLQRGIAASHDLKLKSMVESHARTFTSLRAGHEKFRQALTKLKTSPDDPTANTVAGSYYCFEAGNWDRGLQFLARGNAGALQALANDEIRRPTEPQAVGALADGWWDAAAQLTGTARSKAQRHAAELYAGIVERMPGLRRLVIEKRMSDATVADTSRRVDLLKLVDAAKDPIAGDWRLDDGVLSCPAGFLSRIELPYVPPEEYDFRVSFTVVGGDAAIAQICFCAGHQFAWEMGNISNTISRFGKILPESDKLDQHRDSWLTTGHHYTSVVKVRRTGVEAYIDGKLISSWKTNYSDLDLFDGWRLRHDNAIGVGAHLRAVKFDAIEVVEVTGQGKRTR